MLTDIEMRERNILNFIFSFVRETTVTFTFAPQRYFYAKKKDSHFPPYVFYTSCCSFYGLLL